jgi:hypothetical protein
MRSWFVVASLALGFALSTSACGDGGSSGSAAGKAACEKFCDCVAEDVEECKSTCDDPAEQPPGDCAECINDGTCDTIFDDCEEICNG